MSPSVIRGFEHFLSIENDNFSKNIATLDKDYALILDLDNIYCSSVTITLPDDDNLMIPAFLYLISHQEFYYGMASFLRLHKTQSFRSLRVALDSTFTAYYLLKNPDDIGLYLNRSTNSPQWEKVFRNIKLTIRNNQKQFPSAAGLLQVHDLCSKFAHADPAGILHKYFMDREQKILHVNYFDYEDSPHDYKKWFAFFLFYFFRVFLVYWNEMLTKNAGGRKKEILQLVKDFKGRIMELRTAYPLRDGLKQTERTVREA
jgi:hypothetical protein